MTTTMDSKGVLDEGENSPENQDGAAAAAPHESETRLWPNKQSVFLVVLVIFVAAFVGGITGVLVGNKIDDDDDDDRTDDSQQTVPNLTEAPSVTPTPAVSGITFPSQQGLRSFLEDVSPDQGAALSDSNSPQSEALRWLWEEMETGALPYESNTQIIQRYALAVLFYSTTGEGWNSNLGFLSTKAECNWDLGLGYFPSWYGIMGSLPPACDNLGNVVALQVQNNDLSGTIPGEVALLSDLKFLLLNNNPLSGPIPPSLRTLTHLQVLAISSTRVTGPIPNEFGGFPLLDVLDLSANGLSGPIPTQLQDLSGLQMLDISSNRNISGNIPVGLSRLSNISEYYP